MKGQMFVVGAVIIIVALIAIKGLFIVQMFHANYDHNGFLISNIENEYKRVAAMNYLYGTDNLDDFSLYLKERVADFGVLYVYSKSDVEGHMLTIGNYLGHNTTVSFKGFNQDIADNSYVEVLTSSKKITLDYKDESIRLDISDGYLFYELDFGENVKLGTYDM